MVTCLNQDISETEQDMEPCVTRPSAPPLTPRHCTLAMHLPDLCSLSFLCLHLSHPQPSFFSASAWVFITPQVGSFLVLFSLDLLFLSWPLFNQNLLVPSCFFSSLIALLCSPSASVWIPQRPLRLLLDVCVPVPLCLCPVGVLCSASSHGCPGARHTCDGEAVRSKQEGIHLKTPVDSPSP